MTKPDKPVEPEYVACATCLKQIPRSEAVVPEAIEYVVHFCGLECYEQWQRQFRKEGAEPHLQHG